MKRLGYCTNVHAGTTLAEAEAQLDQHAVPVRTSMKLDRLPIGLWLPAAAMRDIDTDALRHRLDARGLQVYTMNAFPFGDFHGDVVKRRVYEPDWSTVERADYTCAAAALLTALLDPEDEGGVSTLPLGWAATMDSNARDAAGHRMLEVADTLARLEDRTGRCIHLDIEPEPGCALGTLGELADFFEQSLLGRGRDALVRRHLRACVDLCHAAVMFEDLQSVLDRFDELGLGIGKVQVSNAIEVDFDSIDPATHEDVHAALQDFDEPRWMHQTAIQHDGDTELLDDLGDALPRPMRGCWRVHFHVPVHVETLGPLGTTQSRLVDDLKVLAAREDPFDWEVETYAWDALPLHRRPERLADSIVDELQWTRHQISDGSGA